MRLAIIGNSHVGSLKRGWDRIHMEFAPIEITFFAARSDTMRHLELRGHVLVPTNEDLKTSLQFTSQGQAEIDLARFDAILLYCMQARPYFIRRINQAFSVAALRRALRDFTTGRVFFELLKLIRPAFDGPIFIGHGPMVAAERSADDQSVDAYLRGSECINRLLYGPMDARMITQPLETIVNGCQTDVIYTKGSKRLDVGDQFDGQEHGEDDLFHMNGRFGELWLRNFFGELAQRAPN